MKFEDINVYFILGFIFTFLVIERTPGILDSAEQMASFAERTGDYQALIIWTFVFGFLQLYVKYRNDRDKDPKF